ncbi:Ionotropic receptor 394 [Blattella germanica]|nr:Ionotropic receptor 394 [Blattella germanica]
MLHEVIPIEKNSFPIITLYSIFDFRMLPSKICFVLFCCVISCTSDLISEEDDILEETLADCILNISKSYFNKDLPTIVQTPETWRKNGIPIETQSDKFLERFSTYSGIPQVIIGHIKVNLRVQQPNIVKPGSYVMLIPPVLSEQEQYWVIKMFARMWVNVHSPKSRFIIGLNWYCTVDTNFVAEALLNWAYDHSFYDVIVVIPKIRSNEKLPKFDIFGWLSEDQINICSERLKKIRYFDTWIAENKTFLLNANLFPIKEMINKNHCRIKVYHGNSPPFSYKLHEKLTGGIPELLRYSITPRFVPIIKFKNDSHYLLTPVIYNQEHGLRECKMTYPLFALDATWYVPIGHKVAPWRSLYKAFTPGMWMFVFLTSTFGNLFLWFIQRIEQLFFGMKNKTENSIFIIVVLIHLGVGVRDSYTGPASVLLFSLLLFYCLLINTAYQSTLFGLMVEPGEYPPIKTIEELEASKLGLKTYELEYQYESTKEFTTYNNNYGYCNVKCFMEITEDGDYAVLVAKQVGNALRDYSRRIHGSYKVLSLPETVNTYYVTICSDAYNCMLYHKLQKILFRAASSGLLQKWNTALSWWMKIVVHAQFREQGLPDISLWHLQGAFYMLLMGVLFSIFIFVAEILVHAFSSN